jgi:hypothetical protein
MIYMHVLSGEQMQSREIYRSCHTEKKDLETGLVRSHPMLVYTEDIDKSR